MTIIPKYITFEQWAANLYTDFPTLNIPLPPTEEFWKEWARRLIELNQLTNVPQPDTFETWNLWAESFINNV